MRPRSIAALLLAVNVCSVVVMCFRHRWGYLPIPLFGAMLAGLIYWAHGSPKREAGDAANQELDALLLESAEISFEPIRPGIGLKDFVQMVRKDFASRKTKEE